MSIADFNVDLDCDINGRSFHVAGKGAVGPVGVYTATLDLEEIPRGFHPIVISGYTVSICCYYVAQARNGAQNLRSLGATGYETERILRFDEAGEVRITGSTHATGGSKVGFVGNVQGEVDLPDDLACFAQYYAYYRSLGGPRIKGWGEGSLFRAEGDDVRVELTEEYELHNEVTLPWPLYRVVNEHGTLDGLTYRLELHSILDRKNTLAELTQRIEEHALQSA